MSLGVIEIAKSMDMYDAHFEVESRALKVQINSANLSTYNKCVRGCGICAKMNYGFGPAFADAQG